MINYTNNINRNIVTKLLAAISDTPVVFIAGARQTGKSTLAKQLLQNNLFDDYITLDNLNTLNAAKSDPIAFIANYKNKKVIIDEIQRVPDLLLVIKEAIDLDRQPGKFLLTGSANIMLLPKVSESLAGRMETLNLWPLAQQEINNQDNNTNIKATIIDQFFNDTIDQLDNNINKNIYNIWEIITTGGYPEAINRINPERREQWFEEYINSLLQRDIRDIANIEDLTLLPKLLSLIATRTAALVNYAEIARSSAIPESTVKRYISVFENVFIVKKIPAWSRNLSKRLVKSPKLLISDVGLACYLLAINQELLIKNDPSGSLKGQLFENFVIIELLKQLTWSKTRAKLFHYRTQDQKEIDAILETRNGQVVAIEIKAKSTVTTKDFIAIKELAEELGIKFISGYVIYTGDQIIPFGKNIYALPIKYLF